MRTTTRCFLLAALAAALPAPACGDDAATGGGTGSLLCAPGEQRACYGGPEGTEGVGVCIGGLETCNDQGTAFGPCAGQVIPAAEDCSTPEDEDCAGEAPAPCAAEHVWSHRFGGATDIQAGAAAAATADGGVILTGMFDGTIDFGGGPLATEGVDAFVAKLDAAGDHVWSRKLSLGPYSAGRDVAVDAAGGVLVTGSLGGAAFVLKLDAAGNELWILVLAGGDNVGRSVAVDAAGDVLVAGKFSGVLDFGAGQALTSAGLSDVFVAKLDGATGDHVWSQRFGDELDQEGAGVAADPAGGVLLSGVFLGTVDLGGTPLASPLGTDTFFAKLDPQGAPLWALQLSSPGFQYEAHVAAGPAGEALIAGDFDGTLDLGGTPLEGGAGADAFVAQLDPTGGVVWARALGGKGDQIATDVVLDAAGHVLLTGYYDGVLDTGGGVLPDAGGSPDIFVVKLDPSGRAVWARSFGHEADAQKGLGITADPDGNVIFTGSFGATVDFGGGPLTSAGNEDAFAVKLGP